MYLATVTAPVNIATLKYWGKRDTVLNLPTNSSILVSLNQDHLRTKTTALTGPEVKTSSLVLNGKEESLDKPRLIAVLLSLKQLRKKMEDADPSLPKMSEWGVSIVSENNFPTAAGLASLAAGLAALVMAVALLYELPDLTEELSKIARQGSGSACRSVFGGFVAWEMGLKEDGLDSKAVEIAPASHWPGIRAAICVVSDKKKDTSSTSGMQITVKTSSLFKERIENVVPQRFEEMKKSILDKDFSKFAELTMKDSNSFHAVCLDLYPPIFYMNDTSRNIIKVVNAVNELSTSRGQGLVAAYTYDAGPNAVIYYEDKNEELVLGALRAAIGDVEGWGDKGKNLEVSLNLDQLDFEVSRVILTGVGDGPRKL